MTKIENILTHYFVTKVDSNYEKKNRKKISHDCPFKRIQKSHLTLRSMILRGTSNKFEYLSENEAKNETILTH